MQVNIVRYQDEDFDRMATLLADSFESKLCYRSSFTPDGVKAILQGVWDVRADDPDHLYYVAKADDGIVGIIAVRCGETRSASDKGIASRVFSLCRKYGLFSVLRLLWGLTLLESTESSGAYIEHVAVDASMRGRGIGDRLMNRAMDELRIRGFSAVSLAVVEGNAAKRIYTWEGFREIGYTGSRLMGLVIGVSRWTLMKKYLV